MKWRFTLLCYQETFLATGEVIPGKSRWVHSYLDAFFKQQLEYIHRIVESFNQSQLNVASSYFFRGVQTSGRASFPRTPLIQHYHAYICKPLFILLFGVMLSQISHMWLHDQYDQYFFTQNKSIPMQREFTKSNCLVKVFFLSLYQKCWQW